MAKSFLSKFNTLLQANVRGAVRGGERRIKPGDLPDEIAQLRRQFADAEQVQAQMQQRIAKLESEIQQWDAQADDALRAGNEAQARHAVEQMERTRQRRTMMEAERDNHQRAINELFLQINQLEGLMETEQEPSSATPTTEANAPQQSLSEAIRQARQAAEASRGKSLELEVEVELEAIDQELAARRARLAKPE